ncbi:DNA-binding protein [Paenibacillus glufosinatiresistens]|uniref:DNA-binding protein n=1 Tax=Paenibacillus glufosinatiresistens TaxID=3070657 RepID=UPI00286DFFE7|nr:DNA-binding protein [Paenibacillus sp. YX.27]
MDLDLNRVNADSLVLMIRASFTLENWEGILQISDRLYSEILQFYEINQSERAIGQKVSNFGLARNIVYYFGYSMCMKGVALEKLGRHAEARDCIKKYEELGWVNGMDAEGWTEVEYYRNIAKANRYVVDLAEGKLEVVPQYVEFLRNNEEELLPGLIYILEAAIKNGYEIDDILNEYKDQIESMGEYYETKRNIRYYIDYIYLQARYFAMKGNITDSINTLLRTLETSVKLKDDTGFRKAAALFETLRYQAKPEQLAKYLGVMQQILETREEFVL